MFKSCVACETADSADHFAVYIMKIGLILLKLFKGENLDSIDK